jgi:hypothetical protein
MGCILIMEFYVVPIDHLQSQDSDFTFQVKLKEDNLMNFYKNNKLNPTILNDNFQYWFGKFNKDRINEGGYFLIHDFQLTETFKDEEEFKRFVESRNKLLHFFYGSSQTFCLCLWMVKDNSANIPFGLYHNNQIGGGFPMTKNVMVSNSKGRYESVTFKKEDFERANEWFNVLSDYYIEDETGEKKYDTYNNLNSAINHNTNSFKRALSYVEQARSTSFLPAKIASYISVLETLFVVADSNTYKTPERTAVFLSGSIEDKKGNFEIVKDAYSVRSSYVHGSDIGDKKNKKLDVISSELDDIVRKVLFKFFTFHKDLNYSGNGYKKVNQYFVDLVLGGS